MKSFISAILGAVVNANYVTKADAAPGTAHATISTMGGSYEFRYDNDKIKVKATTKTTMVAALALDTDIIETATFIPYAPTSGTPNKWYVLQCKMTYSNTETKYKPSWKVYDHTAAMISHATSDLETADQLGTTTKLSMDGNDVARGTKVIAAPNTIIAADGYSIDWGASDTFAELDSTGKIFTC